jgi:hypothetical protein
MTNFNLTHEQASIWSHDPALAMHQQDDIERILNAPRKLLSEEAQNALIELVLKHEVHAYVFPTLNIEDSADFEVHIERTFHLPYKHVQRRIKLATFSASWQEYVRLFTGAAE